MRRNLREQAELRDQLAAGHPNERGLRLGISDLVAEEVLMRHEADKYRQFLESKAPIAIDRGLSGKFTMKGDLRPHAKDRIVYGSVSGDGMYTVNPFSDKCVAHLIKHGLRYCGRITVVTDVVRENNQTYRLGWTENSKDGTKMGVGSPEYVLLFRKLPTDQANAYADVPVTKSKEEYPRAHWQFDAHSFWRSSGDRFITPDEAASMPMDMLRKAWLKYSKSKVYDFKEHVEIVHQMEKRGILPSSFMALEVPNPGSPHVWDDVTRMRTLNGEQARKGWEQHVCPLQLDIVERLIDRYSNPGDVVCDMFGGIGTVAYSAILKGRKAYTIELSPDYHRDALSYCRGAEQKVSMPTLFSFLETPDDE